MHRLGHISCAHLSIRGAPAQAIQELTGYQDLITTGRYMHLSPTTIDDIQAVAWYRTVAGQGLAEWQCKLGPIYGSRSLWKLASVWLRYA